MYLENMVCAWNPIRFGIWCSIFPIYKTCLCFVPRAQTRVRNYFILNLILNSYFTDNIALGRPLNRPEARSSVRNLNLSYSGSGLGSYMCAEDLIVLMKHAPHIETLQTTGLPITELPSSFFLSRALKRLSTHNEIDVLDHPRCFPNLELLLGKYHRDRFITFLLKLLGFANGSNWIHQHEKTTIVFRRWYSIFSAIEDINI